MKQIQVVYTHQHNVGESKAFNLKTESIQSSIMCVCVCLCLCVCLCGCVCVGVCGCV